MSRRTDGDTERDMEREREQRHVCPRSVSRGKSMPTHWKPGANTALLPDMWAAEKLTNIRYSLAG